MRGLGDNRGSLEIGVDTGSCCSALDLREIMFGVLFMLQSCGLLALFPQALNPKSQTLNPTARYKMCRTCPSLLQALQTLLREADTSDAGWLRECLVLSLRLSPSSLFFCGLVI